LLTTATKMLVKSLNQLNLLDQMVQIISWIRDNIYQIGVNINYCAIHQLNIPWMRRFLVRHNLINGRKYTICDQSQIHGKDLKDLFGLTISGKQLKQILGSMPLLKFMNDDDLHYGMKYQTGINEDLLEFENSSSCSRGGIYVTTLDNCMHYVGSYGFYARQVSIDDDALVYVEDKKLKCNKVRLGPRVEQNQLIRQLLSEFMDENKSEDKKPEIIRMFDQSSALFCYIKIDDKNEDMVIRLIDHLGDRCVSNIYQMHNQYHLFNRPRILMKVIEIDGTMIKIVPKHLITNEIILAAVKQNGLALQYVDHEKRTQGHIAAAIKQNPKAVTFLPGDEITQEIVDNVMQHAHEHEYLFIIPFFSTTQHAKKFITHEMLMSVVKINGMMIRYADENTSTPCIIAEAVRQNPSAIQYVDAKYLTRDVMIGATKANPEILKYVKNHVVANLILELSNNTLERNADPSIQVLVNDVQC
jgi:hypothetical protein